MTTSHFEIQIHAPARKIWDILWSKNTYNQWTKYFNPDSQMKSDWKIGGKTLFVDGKGNGMVSTIQSKKEPYEIVFKHLGVIENGVTDTTSDKIKIWAGALERYHLTEQNGITSLKVMIDVDQEYEKMINDGFTKGLQAVKALSEK